MPLHEIPDVEIFATGQHDGRDWTRDDLKQIYHNFTKLSFGDTPYIEPTVVLGHEDDQTILKRSDLPSAGVVKALRYVEFGTNEAKLFGDYKNVPDEVAGWLNEKRYTKTSAVIYDNFIDHKGQQHGLALKEVAMLGATLPKQKQLAPIPPPVPQTHQYSDNQKTVAVTFKFGDSPMDTEQMIAAIKGTPEGAKLSDDFFKMLDDKALAQLLVDLTGAKKPDDSNAPPKPPAQMGEPAVPPPTPPMPQGLPASVTLKYAELEGRQKALDARLSTAQQLADARLKAEQTQTVESFCDRMVKAGKLTPAQVDHSDDPKTKARVNPANVFDRLMRADAVNRVFKFADRPPMSELELQMAEIEAGPVVLKFGDQMADPAKAGRYQQVRDQAKAVVAQRTAARGKPLEERLGMAKPRAMA